MINARKTTNNEYMASLYTYVARHTVYKLSNNTDKNKNKNETQLPQSKKNELI